MHRVRACVGGDVREQTVCRCLAAHPSCDGRENTDKKQIDTPLVAHGGVREERQWPHCLSRRWRCFIIRLWANSQRAARAHLGAALLVEVDAGLLDGADLFKELLCDDKTATRESRWRQKQKKRVGGSLRVSTAPVAVVIGVLSACVAWRKKNLQQRSISRREPDGVHTDEQSRLRAK